MPAHSFIVKPVWFYLANEGVVQDLGGIRYPHHLRSAPVVALRSAEDSWLQIMRR